MIRRADPLAGVTVASPCSADWESMLGHERARFCGQCELNVYNLSGMSRRDAEDLINRTEGHVCVRFFRRPDGTILTRDCPVGLQAIKRRITRVKRAIVTTVLSFLAGIGSYSLAEVLNRTHADVTVTPVWEHPVMGTMVNVRPPIVPPSPAPSNALVGRTQAESKWPATVGKSRLRRR